MTIQELLNKSAEVLSEWYKNYKLAADTLKQLKKDLSGELKKNDEWLKLEQEIRKLKESRKDIGEQINDKKRLQDQVAVSLEQYQAVQDFAVEMEDKFADEKDKVLNRLSRDLTEKWLEAEIDYKSGRLMLIVAKSQNSY